MASLQCSCTIQLIGVGGGGLRALTYRWRALELVANCFELE